MERQKHLILTGKIPFEEAPDELWMHPALLIDRYANRVIEQRRAVAKKPKTNCSPHEFLDPTPDPPTELTIAQGHRYNKANTNYLSTPLFDVPISNDVQGGYMFTDNDYKKLFYVNPMITEMSQLDVSMTT